MYLFEPCEDPASNSLPNQLIVGKQNGHVSIYLSICTSISIHLYIYIYISIYIYTPRRTLRMRVRRSLSLYI